MYKHTQYECIHVLYNMHVYTYVYVCVYVSAYDPLELVLDVCVSLHVEQQPLLLSMCQTIWHIDHRATHFIHQWINTQMMHRFVRFCTTHMCCCYMTYHHT